MRKNERVWRAKDMSYDRELLADVNEQEERKQGEGAFFSAFLGQREEKTQKNGAEAREGFGGFAAACAALSLACLVCAVVIMLYFV